MEDYHKPPHRLRNNSGELDVFEAARYFSSKYNDNFAPGGGASYMIMRGGRQGHLRAERASLDLPSLKHHHYHHQQQKQKQQQQEEQEEQQQIKGKKYKQTNSPGRKLAQFLNSLINQAITSKKKKSSKPDRYSQSMKDEDEHPSTGRRKRRNSISHFWSTSDHANAKSLYSCSTIGFRSPPTYSLNTNGKMGNRTYPNKGEQIRGSNLDWVDEKFKFKNGFVEKTKNFNHGCQEKKKETKKFKEELDDIDYGVESDSSSDLFELPIDKAFGFCSNGLPVYETTNMVCRV